MIDFSSEKFLSELLLKPLITEHLYRGYKHLEEGENEGQWMNQTGEDKLDEQFLEELQCGEPYLIGNRNKGGKKLPLTIEETIAIKEIQETRGDIRDLTLFSVGLDTMLRSCDLLPLRVFQLMNTYGDIQEEFPVRQQKTGVNYLVRLQPKTRELVKHWIDLTGKGMDSYLFTGRQRGETAPLSYQHYAYLVKKWVAYIGLEPLNYGTHSLRRTKAAILFKRFNNMEYVRINLGQLNIGSTQHYLGVEIQEALDAASSIDFWKNQ